MAKFLVLCVFVSVLTATIVEAEPDGGGQQPLRRQKREWIIPPGKLRENVDYTKEPFIAKIRSDQETTSPIFYSLEGEGADKAPVNLFTVDKHTGFVRVNGILDREKVAFYNLIGIAKFQNGVNAEPDLELRIEVLDENDCAPVFNFQPTGSVYELSAINTYVINITATDADDPKTDNAKIAYGIMQQDPPGASMFSIDRTTGRISVRQKTLDREVHETYTLIIRGTDLDGRAGGNSGTGTVTINILDVNDNAPVLEKDSFEGSVEENLKNVEVIRLVSTDKDQIYTDNWRAVYTIVSGNEAGYFSITTDNITNEGILTVIKELNYEVLKEINLQVSVSNKAAYHHSVTVAERHYPIKIKVVNQPEGPQFQPAVKVISLSEDSTTITLHKVIATYTAIDSDTLQIATNVRYVKGEDSDNWLIIDEKTAEIKLNKFPDRESKFLVNGTYYAKILCITSDHPSKTATGTIAIQVKDFNDHCPTLTAAAQTVCYGDTVLYATATDEDEFPNAEPFEFSVVTKSTQEEWGVEPLNETTVILRTKETLWPGHYKLELEVRDQQGKFCSSAQVLDVKVCMCDKAKVCLPQTRVDSGVKFGAAGVLIMLLGLLLLLLVPLLLLFCVCGTAAAAAGFKPFPTGQMQQLMIYHTEGQGEDKSIPLLQIPTELDGGGNFGQEEGGMLGQTTGGWTGGVTGGWTGGWSGGWGGTDGVIIKESWQQSSNNNILASGAHLGHGGMHAFEGIALSEAFLGEYYSKNSRILAGKSAANDSIRVYELEGEQVSSESFEDICADLNEGDDLAFLNDLGPQFRTLAELSRGSAIEIEISTATKPQPRPVPSGAHLAVKEEGSSHIESSKYTSTSAAASASASASVSASSTHIQATDYHQSSGISSASVLTHNAPAQTLLIQQPAVYYTSTPVYVMDPKPQATVLVAARPVLGMQENVVLLDQTGAQGAATLGLKQTHTKVLVEKTPSRKAAVLEASGPQVLLGHSEVGSGSVRIVKSQQMQTVEPLHSGQSSLHSSLSEGQSVQINRGLTGFQNGLRNHDLPLLTVPQGGAQQKIREERISVVEKSFQSSAST